MTGRLYYSDQKPKLDQMAMSFIVMSACARVAYSLRRRPVFAISTTKCTLTTSYSNYILLFRPFKSKALGLYVKEVHSMKKKIREEKVYNNWSLMYCILVSVILQRLRLSIKTGIS